jgi:hypothetical protein
MPLFAFVGAFALMNACSSPKDTAVAPSDPTTDTAAEPQDSGGLDSAPPPDTGQPPSDEDDTGSSIPPIEGLSFDMEATHITMNCDESWTNPSLSGGAQLNLLSTSTDDIDLQLSAMLRLAKDGIDGEESTPLAMSPSEREVDHRTEVRLPVSLSATDTTLSRGCNWCGGSYALTVTITSDEGNALSDTAEGTMECTP